MRETVTNRTREKEWVRVKEGVRERIRKRAGKEREIEKVKE